MHRKKKKKTRMIVILILKDCDALSTRSIILHTTTNFELQRDIFDKQEDYAENVPSLGS